jgi:hypothetical protein
MRRLILGSLLIGITFLAGCGSNSAPVSGRVTLNGKPLANARVTFQPQSGSETGGLGSSAITDQDGNYSLKFIGKDSEGAMVGKHRVTISSRSGPEEDDSGKTSNELVPEQYNTKSTLTFEVPSGGSKEANFDLKGEPEGPKGKKGANKGVPPGGS